MSGFDCYSTYLAVTNHFKGKYDFFKYHGKMQVKPTAYEVRKDKYFFEKASRKFKRDDFVKYLVANITNGDSWIGELLNTKYEIAYKKWRKRVESLSYTFREELSQMYDKESDFNHLFVIEDGRHPLLFRMYQRRKVSLETLVLLDDLVSYTNLWVKQEDRILNETISIIRSYRPFLYEFTQYNKVKMKKIALEIYS